MSEHVVVPWGLTRMRRVPGPQLLPAGEVVLDPQSQTGLRLDPEGREVPVLERHRRSQTSRETATKTSLDGNTDQGSDQDGDTD